LIFDHEQPFEIGTVMANLRNFKPES